MNLRSIPVSLHPQEVPSDEGAFEAKWVPGEQVAKFQKWTRFWLQRDAVEQQQGQARTVEVHAAPCVQNLQWSYNPLKKKFPEQTFGEMTGPLGKSNAPVDVQKLSRRNLDAVLVWTQDDGYVLDQNSVAELFPEHEKIEQQGDAWVVYKKMLTEEERLTQRMRDHDRRVTEKQADQEARRSTTPEPVTPEERKLQELIEKRENGFLAFGRRYFPNPNENTHLQRPFTMVEHNCQNPLRNADVALRIAGGQRLMQQGIALSTNDPDFFSYDELSERGVGTEKAYAGYAPMERTMMMRMEGVEPNEFDHLVHYHESWHHPQSVRRFQQMDQEEFILLNGYREGVSPKSCLDDELEAYGNEIELLNIMLGNLLQNYTDPSQPYSVYLVQQQLSLREDQMQAAFFMCHMAARYYGTKTHEEVYPREYVEFVDGSMRHDGFDVFVMDGNHARIIQSHEVHDRPHKILT